MPPKIDSDPWYNDPTDSMYWNSQWVYMPALTTDYWNKPTPTSMSRSLKLWLFDHGFEPGSEEWDNQHWKRLRRHFSEQEIIKDHQKVLWHKQGLSTLGVPFRPQGGQSELDRVRDFYEERRHRMEFYKDINRFYGGSRGRK